MATLEDELPRFRGKQELTFLLDHGNALAAGSRLELVRNETVEENASGQRLEGAGNNLEQRGFAAGVWAQHCDHFACLGLKAGGFQREYGRLLWIGRVGVANLFDAEARFVRTARQVTRAAGCRRL